MSGSSSSSSNSIPVAGDLTNNNSGAVVLVGLVTLSLPLFLVIALWIASLFSISAANCVYKLHLLRLGLSHLLFSTDKKFKKQTDVASATPTGKKKHIVFIRHGESEWNVVFNQWSHGRWKTFPYRFLNAIRREFHMASTLDSVFVDSPLSDLGAEQALALQRYIEQEAEGQIQSILRGVEENKTVLVSSNLRRALSTCTIGFWHRLKRTQEKIHILSALQEVTFNVDGVALAKPRTSPILSEIELKAVGKHPDDFEYDRYFDPSENDGDKPVKGKGIDRLNAFAAWCMKRDETSIIAAGHSLYFRYFFQIFLPASSTHIAKKFKIANGAVVSFDLVEYTFTNGKVTYGIDESTITAHYEGFETEEKKKKSG